MKALRIMFSVVVLTLGMTVAAFAQTGTSDAGVAKLAAGFAIAIAALGCSAGMGRAVSAALEGVSRNPSAGPRIMTLMILGLALIESLAIYAFVIAILIK